MKTITTKMLQATDHNGERISVSIDGQRKFISYNYALNAFENHTNAVYSAAMQLNKSKGFQFDALKAIKKIGYINGERGLLVEFN